MTSRPNDKAYLQFPHHSLDAYRVALDALAKADAVAKKLPRGYGPLSDQLRRASQSAFLQLSASASGVGVGFGGDLGERPRGFLARPRGVTETDTEAYTDTDTDTDTGADAVGDSTFVADRGRPPYKRHSTPTPSAGPE